MLNRLRIKRELFLRKDVEMLLLYVRMIMYFDFLNIIRVYFISLPSQSQRNLF